MTAVRHLFENNRQWAAKVRESHPDFFSRLAHQQSPEYLWIGCSDSRVPANEIVGLMPGELNVTEQVTNVGNTTVVQEAWAREQELSVHGWIYDLNDGLLKDLGVRISSAAELAVAQRGALS